MSSIYKEKRSLKMEDITPAEKEVVLHMISAVIKQSNLRKKHSN